MLNEKPLVGFASLKRKVKDIELAVSSHVVSEY
jgi:hypothetical protein